MFVHVKDSTQSGHRNIMIKSSDTDVVVIAASVFSGIAAAYITGGVQ